MMTCIPCEGKGVCKACKGCGRTGYFLVEPPTTARACHWCVGTGRCKECGGKGEVEESRYLFRPMIHVLTSLQTPTSITVAAFTGAPWRKIRIPDNVLLRSFAAQRGWISWRTKRHYKDSAGKCLLFGDILGYVWRHSPDETVRFDVRGNIVGEDAMPVDSTSGWVTFKGKKVDLANLPSGR